MFADPSYLVVAEAPSHRRLNRVHTSNSNGTKQKTDQYLEVIISVGLYRKGKDSFTNCHEWCLIPCHPTGTTSSICVMAEHYSKGSIDLERKEMWIKNKDEKHVKVPKQSHSSTKNS